MAASFDTLEYARSLGEGGFTAEQAQSAAKALSAALSTEMATKADISQLDAKIETTRLQLKSKIETTKLQLESRITESKWETIRWSIGIIGFQAAAVISSVFANVKFVK